MQSGVLWQAVEIFFSKFAAGEPPEHKGLLDVFIMNLEWSLAQLKFKAVQLYSFSASHTSFVDTLGGWESLNWL